MVPKSKSPPTQGAELFLPPFGPKYLTQEAPFTHKFGLSLKFFRLQPTNTRQIGKAVKLMKKHKHHLLLFDLVIRGFQYARAGDLLTSLNFDVGTSISIINWGAKNIDTGVLMVMLNMTALHLSGNHSVLSVGTGYKSMYQGSNSEGVP